MPKKYIFVILLQCLPKQILNNIFSNLKSDLKTLLLRLNV